VPSIADYPRVLQYAPNLSAGLDPSIPAWLPLGWWWFESAGKISDADYTVSSLGGELGLPQLSSDERSATGNTDTHALLSDPDYNVKATSDIINYYGGKVASAGVDSSSDPLYWMLIKFAHGAGSGAMRSLVQGYVSTGGPMDWDSFASWARDNPYKSFDYTDHHLSNTESVRSNGLALATAANLVPPALGAIGGFVPVLAAGALLAGVYYALK
jgi:hypothetical protein